MCYLFKVWYKAILMLPSKCAGLGVAKNYKKTHVQCESVRIKKLLCAECAGVLKMSAHKYSEFAYGQWVFF